MFDAGGGVVISEELDQLFCLDCWLIAKIGCVDRFLGLRLMIVLCHQSCGSLI